MELPKEKSTPKKTLSDKTILLYGQPKSGKSTFASKFPKSLFIATEPGHKFLEVFKVDPMNWSDIKDVCRQLIQQRDDKQFETIVFDTADNTYKMCEDYICKTEGIKHMSDLSFGKGYNLVRAEFMRVINALGQSGYGIVFISHSDTRELDEKGIKRAYTDTTLSGSARKAISGLCDFILYCFINDQGDRILLTKGDENINAGDRSGILPKVMNLSYCELKKHLEGEG
jgi:hypothetical protein